MKTTIHRGDTRGYAHHGWLKSHHTFSFADYYDPARMGFGALRVLNDDQVDAGRGFMTHPHRDMEIVSIPLSGALKHRDSTGREAVIRSGEVQIMSAGRGILHSEMNASATEPVNFLQIWVLPEKLGIEPCYEQAVFAPEERRNRFQLVVSPTREGGALWINQRAHFSLADLDAGRELRYELRDRAHGAYVFVLEGEAQVSGETLGTRDAAGIEGEGTLTFRAGKATRLLLIEVPMSPN